MSITIKKANEIAKLRHANEVVAKTLNYLTYKVHPGLSLRELNAMGESYIHSLGARAAFKGLYGFPSGVCTSVNEVIIHGIPNDYILQEGDIVGLDIGTEVDGWYGDSAVTLPVGTISQSDTALIACAKDALYYAISIMEPEMRFKELSYAIEQFIVARGFVPLRGFCGHGIGRKPHEEPEIPNYLEGINPKSGPKIKNGMDASIK